MGLAVIGFQKNNRMVCWVVAAVRTVGRLGIFRTVDESPKEYILSDPYRTFADLYDRIYHGKDYEKEAGYLRDLLVSEGVSLGSSLLEAGCGTGNYLGYFSRDFHVSGFDRSPAMLSNAKAKLPGVNLFEADMADFSILEPVDALVCLFGGVGYVFPEERLRRAAACFAEAVRPGGCVIVEPWISPEDYDAGRPSVDTYNDPDLAVSRICVAKRDADFSILNFSYSVAFRDHQVEQFTSSHKIWMAPHSLIEEVFQEAGFEMRKHPSDSTNFRGLLVGQRR